MKAFFVVLVCAAVAQVALSQGDASTDMGPPMGVLGRTVYALLTGLNPVGLITTYTGLNLLLVPLVTILLASSGSELGVLGNILWVLTQTNWSPIGLLLTLLQLQGFVGYVLNQLFLA